MTSALIMPSSARLLDWYDANARDLPWRAKPGETTDPYRVWLSEIMLQQTTVATVTSYFGNFVARWPTVHDLAAADLDDILHAWQGLGYYSRARNLHKCAGAVVAAHGGSFPASEGELVRLPGIGPYTAAAVAAIAFGHKATPVDGNIERVVARLFAVETPLPKAKPEIRRLAETLTPDHRAGDFAQAMMDLGATVCRPKAADCAVCPLVRDCKARALGEPARLPVKPPKKVRPTRHGVVYWLRRPDGAVLVRRRPEQGLLGGMIEFPSTPWDEAVPDASDIEAHAPMDVEWRELSGDVEHVFTHFRLLLTVLGGQTSEQGGNLRWCRPEDFGTLALPSAMKKVARHVADSGF
ncbi:MAG: A/G-specific adenine glycosylase [Rhodospirillaceae bacterium]|nr:A/G-specific adenine glycosylase [Rhodospirillaceae bacterium]